MFLLKNFCEKREYIGSKTRNYAKKCFWWWGYVQRNKVVIVFQNRKSWVCHKNWYNLCKTNNFGSNFRNFLLFNSVNISKSKKLSAKPNSFWELGSRVPPLFPALSNLSLTWTSSVYPWCISPSTNNFLCSDLWQWDIDQSFPSDPNLVLHPTSDTAKIAKSV